MFVGAGSQFSFTEITQYVLFSLPILYLVYQFVRAAAAVAHAEAAQDKEKAV